MADKYRTLEELKTALKEKQDYLVRILDRCSDVTIIAPHGGMIEKGSSAIAEAVSGGTYNLYDFQGLQVRNAQELHVSSTRFRDPPLNSLLQRSELAVSIHGMGNQGESVIWLGGLNGQLKRIVLAILRMQGFAVNPDPPRYRGESPVNIVNPAKNKGVQLELSNELFAELFEGKAFLLDGQPATRPGFGRIVTALQDSIRQYRTADMCA